MSNELTPIRKQYLNIKKQYPDSIVFFRLGDFYETFDDDAHTTSKELDIVLTSRNVAKGQRVPMAGIPYHAVDNYLSRLIAKGYHVAICEQVGNQPINGLVPREVVRIMTPGTVIEPNLLQSDKNNYLACVYIQDDKAGISYVDITTGEFATSQLSGNDINGLVRGEVLRINPSEILISAKQALNDLSSHISTLPDWKFEEGRCRDTLINHFSVSTLDGFGLKDKNLSIKTSGAILQYIQESHPKALSQLNNLHFYSTEDYMHLDPATRRNLELTETILHGENQGSLLNVLDNTITPMGHRLIRQWINKPLLNINEINFRQECVKHFFDNGIKRKEFRESIKSINDLERLTNRILSGQGLPRDLIAIKDTLNLIPKIRSILINIPNPIISVLEELDPCIDELNLINESISDDTPATLQNIGVIKSGYSNELDDVIESSKHARDWIANLENVERQNTGIKNLKVGYNKVFGYYIEISRSHTDQAPENYIRKQTLVNAERYITPEMKEYETLIINAEERIREIENRIFKSICNSLSKSSQKLLHTARSIAILDVFACFAETAIQNNYIKPEILQDPELEINDGRHPVVEKTLRDNKFIPNDAIYEKGENIRIITGPNMSGKSTFLRQIALIVLMAQMGSFVPASSAKIGLVDRIFTRIGAQDEIHAGQSTFMVEMIETANILNHATSRSLLILDEIGRGTSTYDGVSIAWAVVEYIHNHPDLKSRTLFATHYHELTQLPDILPGVRNYNVAVSEAEEQVIFLHKIIKGSADRSYGIHVARLAGIPKPIILRANDILNQLQNTSGDVVQIENKTNQQMALFPETNPLLERLNKLDLNSMSPIEALTILYEWKNNFCQDKSL